MTNDRVVETLQALITSLGERLSELVALQQDPGGSLSELPDRTARVAERISSINLRILHLQQRMNERKLAAQVGTTVPPLSPARAAELGRALQKVSRSIATANTFKQAIRLAAAISETASKAHGVTAVGS